MKSKLAFKKKNRMEQTVPEGTGWGQVSIVLCKSVSNVYVICMSYYQVYFLLHITVHT